MNNDGDVDIVVENVSQKAYVLSSEGASDKRSAAGLGSERLARLIPIRGGGGAVQELENVKSGQVLRPAGPKRPAEPKE